MADSQCCEGLKACRSKRLGRKGPDQHIDADSACRAAQMGKIEEPEVQKRVMQAAVDPFEKTALPE
ncbi:hypothetical protein D3C72_2232440 [compost metagenome]